MTEIRVPVTAPGATQAANELRNVQAAAQGVGKAEEAVAKNSTKLAQAQRVAAQSSKSAAQAFLEQSKAMAAARREQEAMARAGSGRAGAGFMALGRAGGMGGGLLGRIGGGLGSPALGALGPVAAGAAVAGLGLMKLAEASAHSVERATALAKAFSDMTQTVRGAQAQGQSNAMAAFKENGQVLRQLIAAGIDPSRASALAGRGFTDAPEAMASLSRFSDFGKPFGRAAMAMETAQVLQRLGVTANLMEGLKMLPEDRVAGAMAGGGSTQLLREIIGGDGGPIPLDTLTMMLKNSRASRLAWNLNDSAAAEGGFRGARLMAATSGEAAAGFLNERSAWANPVAAAIREQHQTTRDQLDQMTKVAEAQGTVARIMANVFTPSGGLRVQVMRAENDAAAVSLGSTY